MSNEQTTFTPQELSQKLMDLAHSSHVPSMTAKIEMEKVATYLKGIIIPPPAAPSEAEETTEGETDAATVPVGETTTADPANSTSVVDAPDGNAPENPAVTSADAAPGTEPPPTEGADNDDQELPS